MSLVFKLWVTVNSWLEPSPTVNVLELSMSNKYIEATSEEELGAEEKSKVTESTLVA